MKALLSRKWIWFIEAVFLIGLLLCFITIRSQKENKLKKIHEIISLIPLQDRKKMEGFFKLLFIKDAFAYTLFGDKPISWECRYNKNETKNIRVFLNSFYCNNLTFYEGLQLWKKYKPYFPMTHYDFSVHESADGYISISLINKKAFFEIVNQHYDDFIQVLGSDFSPQKLLQECSEKELSEAIHHHNGLLGTLLGFGRNNAWQFVRFAEISTLDLKTHQFHLNDPSLPPSQKFTSIEEEFEYLKNTHTSFIPGYLITQNPFPMFVANPDLPETHALRAKYKKQHKVILKHLQKADFLEEILKQLIAE